MAEPLRGEVWFANLGPPTGRELAMARPVVIIKANDIPTPSVTIVVPLTTRLAQRRWGVTVEIPQGEAGLTAPSLALCHGIRALDIGKLSHRIGALNPFYLTRIERRLVELLGIPA